MRNRIPFSLRFLTLYLVASLLACQTQAAVTYWDPQGTFTPTPPSVAYTGEPSSVTPPFPGTLAGTWETASWSTASGGSATPVAWIEGTAACFAVGAGATNNPDTQGGASTTSFTITMNQNHSVAGMFNGSLNPNSCHVTIQDAGTMNMVAGNLNAISLGTSTDGSTAYIAINVPIAGGTTAGLCAEQNGQVFLNGNNSAFAGGTYLGYNGSSFAVGIWHFNDNAAFGTSPIILLNSTGGALVTETSGLTITNPFTMYQKFSANVNTIGSTPQPATLNLVAAGTSGVTFSGPWALSGGSGWTGANIYANTSPWGAYTVLNLNAGHGTGDEGDLINISGPLSGTCALTKGGSGILELSGDNSSFSGPLTIASGTLRVGYPTALGCNGAVSTNATITVASGTTSGTLDLNGYAVNAALILNGNGDTGAGALVNSNTSSTAVLNAPSGVLAALITSPFFSTTIATPVTATVTGGGGSGATAVASLGVTPGTFTVTPNTQKYTVMPTITVTGGGGSNAIVPMPLSAASPAVVSSTAFVTCPGLGYASAPSVSVTGGTKSGTGTAPTVTANANNFQLVGLQITSPGSGYTSQPTISLSGTGVDAGTAVGLISSVTLASSSSIGGPGNIVINSAIGDSGSGFSLTQLGPGTLTLGAVNTYSGATTVTGGKLVGVVGGSCASSPVEVQPGRTLGVSIPDNTKQWTCENLTFDDSTTTSEFNFGSVTPSATLAPLNVTGNITFGGAPTVTVLAAGSLPAGTYPLMTAIGGLGGSIPTTANLNLPPHVSATLSNDGFTLSLVVSGNTEPLTWAVNGSGSWDINTTADWKDGTSSAVNYLETAAVPPVGDAVVFNDVYNSSSPTITLNTVVSPVAVTVNSTHNYTISGTGGIAGETGLSQQGSGTLELDCVSTFTGSTTIAAGALTIGGAGQLGGGVYSGSIANNGTFTYNSSAPQTLSGPITGTGLVIQNGAGRLILSGANSYSGGTTIAAGTLQIGDGVLFNGSTVPGNITDNGSLVFANFYPQTFSGNLGGTGSLTVSGPASLTLSGVNTYIGGTTINAGSLIFNNAAAQTLSGVISGAGTLVQKGPGLLTLAANNSYTGGTTISGGILSVNGIDDSGLNSNIGTTGTLRLGGGTLRYTGAGAATTGRTVTGTGTIDLPAGNLELGLASSGTINKTSAGTLTLSGTADNASLGLTINAGTVILNKVSASTVHAIGATTTVNNGGKLQLSGTGGDQIFSGVNVTVNSGGVFDSNGLSEGMTSLTLNGAGTGTGALINNGAACTITTTAASGFPLGSDTSIGGTGNLTLTGVMSGAHALTYIGNGTLALSSANTYSLGTTISSGTVEVVNKIAGNVNNTGGFLKLDTATSLATTAILTLASSPAAGAVNLNFTGTQTISALNFGATSMAQGTWGRIGSGALHENAAFVGNGFLKVTSGGPAPAATTITSIAGTSVAYTGGSGSLFVLLGTNDVTVPSTNWTRLATNGSTPGSFTIPAVGSSSMQFYRVKSE
jgi:autotransporter-associated beta strand protein